MARIVVTDIAWPNLDIEAALAAAAGHEVVLAESDAHLRDLAPTADALLATGCVTVARYGVGVDNIDVVRATELGMIVSNVPEFCTEEVADHTLLLALATLRNLRAATDATRGDGWATAPAVPSRRIRGLVFGIVGFGAIGRAVAERAAAFGFEVVVASRALAADPALVPSHVTRVVSQAELLAEADIVSLHVPLTPATRHLIGAPELAAMKDGALLINVSRGGLVDTDALRPELESGRLRVALDVTDPEPLPAGHWLRADAGALITPHVAFSSDGSLVELAIKATSNALAVLAGGRPASIVNPEVLTSGLLRTTHPHHSTKREEHAS
jgi:D-3-phosphoglycerate dehydrogenase / 2-oxoglutarate reductase